MTGTHQKPITWSSKLENPGQIQPTLDKFRLDVNIYKLSTYEIRIPFWKMEEIWQPWAHRIQLDLSVGP